MYVCIYVHHAYIAATLNNSKAPYHLMNFYNFVLITGISRFSFNFLIRSNLTDILFKYYS